MNKATQRNYIEHFGPDAFVPGYCGKCPGAGRVGDDPVCTVYADDPAPRILPDPQGCNEPPDWCPIRHISRQPLLAEGEVLRVALQEIEVAAAEDERDPGAQHYDWIRERAQKALASSRKSPNG